MIPRPLRAALAISALAAMLQGCAGMREPADNIAPLAFGLTEAETAAALGAPLVLVAGQPGRTAEYRVDRGAGIGPLSPAVTRVSLQFRNGRLTGWKRQWQRTAVRLP
ncbi:MAG TPA: hypothetical protein VNQ99_15765 [Xanthobacteraceae bacterium]|nr:hypothetical protein [Xanthobacteraceae bacterium]